MVQIVDDISIENTGGQDYAIKSSDEILFSGLDRAESGIILQALKSGRMVNGVVDMHKATQANIDDWIKFIPYLKHTNFIEENFSKIVPLRYLQGPVAVKNFLDNTNVDSEKNDDIYLIISDSIAIIHLINKRNGEREFIITSAENKVRKVSGRMDLSSIRKDTIFLVAKLYSKITESYTKQPGTVPQSSDCKYITTLYTKSYKQFDLYTKDGNTQNYFILFEPDGDTIGAIKAVKKSGNVEIDQILITSKYKTFGYDLAFCEYILDELKCSVSIHTNASANVGDICKDLHSRGYFIKPENNRIQISSNINEINSIKNAPQEILEIGEPVDAEFRQWFAGSKVVDSNGNPLILYHGSTKVSRIDKFRKSRATSGPMSYFTDNPDVASAYSINKKDTSYDRPDSYEGWFLYKLKRGNPIKLSNQWYRLSSNEQKTMLNNLYSVGYENPDEGEGRIVNGTRSPVGKDTIDYELRKSRGNVISTLIEIWLSSGLLFGEERTFLDVLRACEFPDMKNVIFADPDEQNSGVVPVYLNIKNPLVTSNVPMDVITSLKKVAGRYKAKIHPAGNDRDAWDKNLISGLEWIKLLENNTVGEAWTVIPDWVTKTLIYLGYDGIADTGGKHSGKSHGVWIPFSEDQVRFALYNKPNKKKFK